MSTLTSRLSLIKPATTELYDIGIFNSNADIVDRIGGITICTSVTRPSSPFSGMTIYESDTGKILVWVPGSPGSWNVITPGNASFVCTSTTRPASPYQGQMIYETNTGLQYIWVTSAWVTMTNGLRGGKTYISANATLASGTTTEFLAGMDAGAVNLDAGRQIRVRAKVEVASSVAGDSVTFRIRNNNVSGTVYTTFTTPALRAAATKQHFEFEAPLAIPTTGLYSFVVTAVRASGTGTITISSTANVSPFVTIEQLGPSTVMTLV